MTVAYEMGAIREFLLADPAVAALVGERVYAHEVPDGVLVGDDAPKCVLISSAGGAWISQAQRTYMQVDGRMKDLRCYGETPYEARRVWDAANDALKNMRRHMRGDCLLYSAMKVGGPTSTREPETEYAISFGSYQVLAAEVA